MVNTSDHGVIPSSGEWASQMAGRRLNLRPNVLLVPWEREVTAAQLLASLVAVVSTGT